MHYDIIKKQGIIASISNLAYRTIVKLNHHHMEFRGQVEWLDTPVRWDRYLYSAPFQSTAAGVDHLLGLGQVCATTYIWRSKTTWSQFSPPTS